MKNYIGLFKIHILIKHKLQVFAVTNTIFFGYFEFFSIAEQMIGIHFCVGDGNFKLYLNYDGVTHLRSIYSHTAFKLNYICARNWWVIG